jgi:mobilization protein NikA
MSKATSKNKPKTNDLERVEVKPRASRGAVISVRLTSDEAQSVATSAEKASLSVAEFARRAIQRSLRTGWRLMVWNGTGPVVLGVPPQTGGDYARLSSDADTDTVPLLR